MTALNPLNVGGGDEKHDHILIRDCKIKAGPGYAIGIVIAEPHPASAAHKEWFDHASNAEQDAHLAEHKAANRD